MASQQSYKEYKLDDHGNPVHDDGTPVDPNAPGGFGKGAAKESDTGTGEIGPPSLPAGA